ncbi:MAG TPA: M15 family metallopeptidase [Syntrophorhabdaceae bacterium]|nr:M15 family metallopeptidase [Syntrophorhabdaceae bacterium]HQM80802.1 M15 family metallopeptidase [Syntrophorhabdaceae bacterium]
MARYACTTKLFIAIALLWLPIAFYPLASYAAGPVPAGFVDIQDVIPSVVLDIRYYTAHNFVGERIDGYNAPKCIITKKAADALAGVQKGLMDYGFSLKVYDCYRPARAVSHFVRWAKDVGDTKTKKEFYPTVDKRNLFRDGYIAERSSHSRGSTVDLTIVPMPVQAQEQYTPGQALHECYLPAERRFKDNGIDMGTGYDCFHELSHTANREAGEAQRMGRLLLKTLMERHGFVNYDQEWWHYTLKDEPYPETYFDFAVE